jgi:hypothetical protein
MEALELLFPYLQHSDADIRTAVVESFGHYPARAEVLVPALRAALEGERDEEIRARIKNSLQSLSHVVGPAS